MEDINVMEKNEFPVHKLIKIDIGHWKKEVGKVIFGKDDILWNVKKEKKEIKYNQISMIYIGDCPSKYRFRDYWGRAGRLNWMRCYGKYIVALNLQMDDVLFVCSYNNKIWKILKERCKQYEVIFSEEDEIEKAKIYREKNISLLQNIKLNEK